MEQDGVSSYEKMERCITGSMGIAKKVYLIGAGPGDIGLITVKGLNCLRQADVIIYDRLINEKLLDSARPDAELIYVGSKSVSVTKKDQEEINRLLVSKAEEGKIVVRLKGGDPFVLGRGGEEAQSLAHHGVPFEIVPGVSAALAVPAYAGIPITHRHLASSFAVITGHEDPSKDVSSIAWDKLTTGVDTLIFLMGVANLTQIVESLLQNGRMTDTPVALIQQGTTPEQRTLVGKLGNIVSRAEQYNFQPPVVIIVGEVVQLHDELCWFDNRPLFGKRVLVTRTRHQASSLSQLLLEYGAQPIEMPVIEVQYALRGMLTDTGHPPQSVATEPCISSMCKEGLDQAILSLESYQWVIFTSVNGVGAFFHQLHALHLDTRWLRNIQVGAIGPATAKALEKWGIYPDFIPEEYTSHGIIAGLKPKGIEGCHILLPRADIASRELVEGLTELGAEAHEVTAYVTLLPTEVAIQGRQMLLDGKIDIVTFTSSSTVNNLLTMLGEDWQIVNKTKVACIGTRTADTARNAGLRVDIIAKEQTIPGLVKAIKEAYNHE